MRLRRGEQETVTQCEERCPLLFPEGEGSLVLRVDGPNPECALEMTAL